jgi:hypothetical protein
MKEFLAAIIVVALILILYLMKFKKGKNKDGSCCGKTYGSKFPE